VKVTPSGRVRRGGVVSVPPAPAAPQKGAVPAPSRCSRPGSETRSPT